LWTKHRDLVEADLHEVFGVDVESGILRERTWRWFQRRIAGVLTCDSRIHRKLHPPEKTKPAKTPATPHIPHRRR